MYLLKAPPKVQILPKNVSKLPDSTEQLLWQQLQVCFSACLVYEVRNSSFDAYLPGSVADGSWKK